MLEFLRGRANERKLRLFAVACWRAVWGIFLSQDSQNAVEVSEQFADGLVTPEQLHAARVKAFEGARAIEREAAAKIGGAEFAAVQLTAPTAAPLRASALQATVVAARV